jgi:hypothetical protein
MKRIVLFIHSKFRLQICNFQPIISYDNRHWRNQLWVEEMISELTMVTRDDALPLIQHELARNLGISHFRTKLYGRAFLPLVTMA